MYKQTKYCNSRKVNRRSLAGDKLAALLRGRGVQVVDEAKLTGFIKSGNSQNWKKKNVYTELRDLLIRRLSTTWERWIAT